MKTRVAIFCLVTAGMTLFTPRATRAQFGMGPEQEVMARFDRDGDKKLNAAERQAALNALGGGGGLNIFFMRGGSGGAVRPGPSLTPAAVKNIPASVPFYDPGTLRTLFLQFEDKNWEEQLMAFKPTDIEVPATLTMDGKIYNEVGVKFRGSSSFFMVPEGQKHSFNISMDAFTKDQTLLGFDGLNLLSAHQDASYLRSVLYLQIARDYIPAARANYVRVVINGESWGVYPNVEQVNKTFLKEWFKTDLGTRWKVPGMPNGNAGLLYWGDNPENYRGAYEIKGKDDPKAWAALINLTKVLNSTPIAQLEAALAPILDIDGVLRFLAVENALANQDGYWVRASDYNIYLDPAGKFHIVPHDTNETFGVSGAPPDPLVGLNDSGKPLRSRLLAVPALRAKYLQYMRDIATKWLDWKTLEPLVTKYHALIAEDVRTDTHKIDPSYASFEAGAESIRSFAARRQQQILTYPQR